MSGPEIDPRAATLLFGNRIRQIREEQGISQDALAHRAGLHSSIVGRLERGVHQPTLSTILAVGYGLGVDPAELLAGLLDATHRRPGD